MEAGYGVELKVDNGTWEKAPEVNRFGSNVNKDNKVIENGSNAVQANGVLIEDPLNEDDLQTSGAGNEASEAILENKVSNLSKETGSDGDNRLKSVKVQKDRDGQNGAQVKSQNKKPSLSQGLSFPARGTLASSLRKSTTSGMQGKADVKGLGSNGSEVPPSITNGELPAKQSNSAAACSTRPSLQVKYGSVDATINGTSSEAMKISATSCAMAQQKSTSSGFNFRLDERAKKRKEFFLKLEEKIQQKELEKTNLQARSKENQEAEIRQLRKSLTFKATPMPSFYQEPGPPKVELKKIPPTRARSPKLGRNKPSIAAADNPLEGSSQNPHPSSGTNKSKKGVANNKGASTALKKPIQKSLSRLPTQKSTAAKVETEPLRTEPKASDQKPRIEKPMVGESDGKSSEVPPEAGVAVESVSLENASEEANAVPENTTEEAKAILENTFDETQTMCNLSFPGNAPNEVSVEG